MQAAVISRLARPVNVQARAQDRHLCFSRRAWFRCNRIPDHHGFWASPAPMLPAAAPDVWSSLDPTRQSVVRRAANRAWAPAVPHNADQLLWGPASSESAVMALA